MLAYVAAPYSAFRDKNQLMRDIARISADYMIAHPGQFLVSGLCNHYACLENPTLGTDFAFWKEFCVDLMRRCDKLIVIRFGGWDESVGVRGEIHLAMTLGLPIEFIDIN